MKKLGLLLMVVVFSATISMAQNRGGQKLDPKERAEQEVKKLTEKLDLSTEQGKKVYDVLLKGNNEMTEMRKAGGGDRDAMREKMMKLRSEQNAEMKKILSEAQLAKYEKYQEERRSERGTRGGGGQKR